MVGKLHYPFKSVVFNNCLVFLEYNIQVFKHSLQYFKLENIHSLF